MSRVQKGSVGRYFIICYIISSVMIVALSMLMSGVALMTKDPTSLIGIFSLLSLIISAALSGFANAKLNPTEKISFPLTVCLAVTMTMLFTGVILSKGHMSLGSLMNYLCYFGIYALLSYFGAKGGRKHKRKRLTAHLQ